MNHSIPNIFQPILEGIARDKQRFQFDCDRKNGTLKLKVTCGNDDAHVLSGNGSLFDSTRRLISEAGKRNGTDAQYILDSNGPGDFIEHKFKPDPEFNESYALELIFNLCEAVGIKTDSRMVSEDGNGKLSVFIPTPPDKRELMADINNLFFAYGWTNGRKINVKTNK